MSHRIRVAFLISLALGCLVLAPLSSARGRGDLAAHVDCEFTPATGELSIHIRDWGGLASLALRRGGDVLTPYGQVQGDDRTRLPCSPEATIAATDHVSVAQAPEGTSDPFGRFAVDFSAGDFAPGRTAESEGESEIELALDLPETDLTLLVARDEPTEYTAKHSRDAVRIDPNGDGDLDVASTAANTNLFAGDSHDILDASLGRRSAPGDPGLSFFGFGGSDRITTGGASDSAIGGPGSDLINARLGSSVILAGGGADRIRGGPGYQLIDAGTGNDRVNVRRGSTDEIHCGPGRDLLLADKEDTGDTTGCERIRTQKR
jgi:hypothetical protein